MSLVLWYPLKSSINNQGVLGANYETISTTGAFSAGGVLGNYMTSGACYIGADKSQRVFGQGQCSISLWYYNNGGSGIITGNSAMSYPNNRGYSLFAYPNATDLHYSFQKDDDSVIAGGVLSGVLIANQWVHICVVDNGTNIKIYLNGVQQASISDTLQTGKTWSAYSQILINNNSGTGKNDFRVYDHALSIKEVKELAKGLACQYSFDNLDQCNSSYVSLGIDGTFESYSDGATTIFTNQMNSGAINIVSGVAKYNNKCLSLTSAGGSNRVYRTFSMAANTKYIISCWYKGSVSNSSALHFERGDTWGGGSTAYTDIGNWQYLEFAYTPEVAVTGYYFFCVANGYTAYIDNISIQQVSITTVGDNSGCLNTGTISGTASASTDCKRGNNSIYLDSAYVASTTLGSYPKMSMSMWIKIPVSSIQRFVLGTFNSWTANGVGFWHDANSSGLSQLWKSDSESSYLGLTGYTNIIDNTWHHIGFTYDGTTVISYKDGVEYARGTYGSNGTISNPLLRVGGGSGFNNEQGNVDDFRIYGTALTADDMLDIYNGGIKIDKNGNIYASQFIESQAQNITKKSVVNSKNIIENGASKYFSKYDKMIYVEPDGSQWMRIMHHNNPATNLFSSSDTFTTFVYTDSNRWFDVSLLNNLINNNGKYELMVKQMPATGGAESKYRWTQSYNPMTATYANTVAANVTYNSTTGYTVTNFGGLYRSTTSNTYLNGNNAVDGNWWGATGCWTAFSGGIPGWASIVVTTGYMDLYYRIDTVTTKPENTTISTVSIGSSNFYER